MAKKSDDFNLDKISVASIDAMNYGEFCDFFVDVAENCPDRANEAIAKIIAFWKMDEKRRGKPARSEREWVNMAYDRVGWVAGYYDAKTQDLLLKTFKKATHPIYGRNLGTQAVPVDFKQVTAATRCVVASRKRGHLK